MYLKHLTQNENLSGDDDEPFDGFLDDEFEPHKFGTTVLPVANLPDSFSGVPQDGMQYLFTVRREGKRLPFVTRAPNPFPTNEAGLAKQSKLPIVGLRTGLPTEEWRTCFADRFRNFRANIRQRTIHVAIPRSDFALKIPKMRERDQWWAFFRGDNDWEHVPSSQFHTRKYGSKKEMKSNVNEGTSYAGGPSEIIVSQCNDKGKQVVVADTPTTPRGSPNSQIEASSITPSPREPTQEFLNLLDQKTTLHLLKYFIQWIQGHFDPSFLPSPPPLSRMHFQTGHPDMSLYNFTPSHGRWIFALLSWLDAQLTSEEISVLRNLARQVVKVIRAEKLSVNTIQGTPNASHIGEAACWMIVAAVASGWGQADMWMDAEEALR